GELEVASLCQGVDGTAARAPVTCIHQPAGSSRSPSPFEPPLRTGTRKRRSAMADTETPQRAELPARISSSLALVWRRYAGERPTSVETAIVGTRISCVLTDSVQGFDQGMASSELDDGGRTGPAPTLAGYRRE